MLLWNNIGPGPQATIAWQNSPIEAYNLLVQRYSHLAKIQRASLYRGITRPKLHLNSYINVAISHVNNHSSQELVIELPSKPLSQKKEYTRLEEPSTILESPVILSKDLQTREPLVLQGWIRIQPRAWLGRIGPIYLLSPRIQSLKALLRRIGPAYRQGPRRIQIIVLLLAIVSYQIRQNYSTFDQVILAFVYSKRPIEITTGLPNFDSKSKAIRKTTFKPIPNPPTILGSIEGDTFKINPTSYNKKPIGLLFIDRKTRYRQLFLLPNKEGPTVFTTIKGFFKSLKNKYRRYSIKLHYDRGKEINSLLQDWLSNKGIDLSSSSLYIHEQNGLVERSIRIILDRLRATIALLQLPLYLQYFIIPSVLELVNSIAVSNKDLTPYQAFFDELEPSKTYRPNLGQYKAIGSSIEVLIPKENRSKS